MIRVAKTVSAIMLILTGAANAQSPVPKPPPEMRDWGLWVGEWTMVGTAKDTPAGPEYRLDWRLRGRWILGGFAVQLDHIWKGSGPEGRILEILYWDPVMRTHAFHGFGSGGWTWTATASFSKGTSLEDQKLVSPDGRIAACRNTWVLDSGKTAISGKSECELDGVPWTAFAVKGTRTRTFSPAK